MVNLLRETLQEISRHIVDVFRCFWPVIFYLFALLCVSGLWIYLSDFLPKDLHESWIVSLAVVVLFFMTIAILFASLVAPAAVRWHRVIVTGQTASWWPTSSSRSAFHYMLLIFVLTIAFIITSQVLISVWNDLLMPMLAAFLRVDSYPPELVWYELIDAIGVRWISTSLQFARLPLGNMAVAFVYVMIFGRLYLRLPEISLDPQYRGARKFWTKRERWQFLLSLFSIFSFPFLVEGVEHYAYILRKIAYGDGLTETYQYSMLAGFVSTVMSVTLLSVAYRRNLNRREESLTSPPQPSPMSP